MRWKMSNTAEKQERQLLTYFRHLPLSARQEAIDFAGLRQNDIPVHEPRDAQEDELLQ